MFKLAVAVLLISTATTAGKKQQKPVPEVQCRVMAFDPTTKGVHIGKWIDCIVAEGTAQYIYETLDHPGLIIWTDEQTKEGKKWSEPTRHSEPKIIPPDDFGDDWNNS